MKKTFEVFEVEVKEILTRGINVEIEMNGQSEEMAEKEAVKSVERQYSDEKIVLDDNDYIETIIEVVNKENNENANISPETIKKITKMVNENNIPVEDKKKLADIFDIRVCTVCGSLMYEGYLIIDDYACNDDCKAKLITEEEFEEAFKFDEAYYTEWI